MPQLSYRQYCLRYGSIDFLGLVSKDLYFECTELRKRFQLSLTEHGAENEPSSPAELSGKFLGFIAPLVNPHRPGKFDKFLREALLHFHLRYLHSTDIHCFVDSLLIQEEDPVKRLKVKENIIKGYYLAIVNCNIAIENMQKTVTRKAYGVFGGYNNPGYLTPLVEHYKLYGVFTHTVLLFPIAAKLKELIRYDSQGLDRYDSSIASLYPQGFDILSWLQNPELAPDFDYLMSVPVSCPMITLVQLADYALQCRISGSTPGEFRKKFLGMAGWSHGIVAAVAIALSDSWDSFSKNAVKAVSLMLLIGARAQLVYPKSSVLPLNEYDYFINSDDAPSAMLMIKGITLEKVEHVVGVQNRCLDIDKQIVIALFNSPTHFGITGPPESLYELKSRSRKVIALKGCTSYLLQKKHALDYHKLYEPKIKNKFSSIFRKGKVNYVEYAYDRSFFDLPFHSYLLKDSRKQIVKDLTNLGIEFSSMDIEVPVYDTYDGSNLQDHYRNIHECSLTSRLVKLIVELPVHWETITKIIGTDYTVFGPKDDFKVLV